MPQKLNNSAGVKRSKRPSELTAKRSMAANEQAKRAVANNVGRVSELVDKYGFHGEVLVDRSKVGFIHATHDIKPVQEDPNAVYCARCGAWTTDEAPKILKQTCEGQVKPGSVFQHRLLQLGIVPKPRARIPQHAKKKSKTKW